MEKSVFQAQQIYGVIRLIGSSFRGGLRNLMAIAVSALTLYIACFAFFYGGARSARSAPASPFERFVLHFLGWALAAFALLVAAAPFGWERGIAIWLGLFALAGCASLLCVGLWPRAHRPSALAAGLLCALIILGNIDDGAL